MQAAPAGRISGVADHLLLPVPPDADPVASQNSDDYFRNLAKLFGLCLLFVLFASLVTDACTQLYDHIREENRNRIRLGSGFGAARNGEAPPR